MSYTTIPSTLFPLPSTITINYDNGSQIQTGTYTLQKGTTVLSTKSINSTNTQYSYPQVSGSGSQGGALALTTTVDNNGKLYITSRKYSFNSFSGIFTHENLMLVYDIATKNRLSAVTVPFASTNSGTNRNDATGNSYYSSNANMIYTPYSNIYSTSSIIVGFSTTNLTMTSIGLWFCATGVWGDNNGNLYITSFNSTTILKYNISSTTFTTAFSNASSVVSGYFITLIIGNDGFIYALNSNGNIYKIATNDSTCTLFSGSNGFNNISYNPVTGDIYGFNGNSCYIITPSGTNTLIITNIPGIVNQGDTPIGSVYSVYDNSIYYFRTRGGNIMYNFVFPTNVISYTSVSTSTFSQGVNTLQIYKNETSFGIPIILNTAIVGTAPTITSITTHSPTSFSVFFTTGTGGNPAPSTYYYSLNGGSSYINANSTTSPILISGVASGINYRVALIANNVAGNTAPSNISVGFIPYPCFLQGTKILRMNQETDDEEYVAVETLRRGDLIKTANHGYKAIELIGFREIPNPLDISKPSSRLYWLRKSKISGMRADLCVTGDHCILHKSISDKKKQEVFEYMGDLYVTEGHYRVPAFLDDRAEPYTDSAPATIWHFALEHNNIYHNYGVMANGLLVESSSLHYMYKYSNMKMI